MTDESNKATVVSGRPRDARIFGAAAITIVGFGFSIAIRMGNNLTLSYLLLPELFGLMTLANVVLQGVQMCSDVGVGACLVQHPRAEERTFNNTAWTLQIGRGLMIWGLLVLASGPLASFYEEPRLQWLVIALGFTALLQSSASTSVYLAKRRLLIGRLTALEVGTQLLGAIVMCSLATVWRNEWALVVGTILSTAVYVALTHFSLGRVRNWFAWDHESVWELMRFGKWIVVGTLISFLALQIDRILLGKIGTFTQLGIYHLALAIAMLGPLTMERLSMSIQFPLLSEAARQSSDAFRQRLFQSRLMLLDAGQLLILGIFAIGPVFFGFLYHDNYSAAGSISQILCFQAWCVILSKSIDRSLLALGDTRCLAIAAFAGLSVGTLGSVMGFWFFGLYGFCFGVGIGALGSHFCLYPLLRRHGIHCGGQDLKASASVFAFAMVVLVMQRSPFSESFLDNAGLVIPMAGHWWGVIFYIGFASFKGLLIYKQMKHRCSIVL